MYKWQLEDVTFSIEQMIEAQDQDYFFPYNKAQLYILLNNRVGVICF